MRRQRAEQPAAREGRAGQGGKTERPVLPRKPGNAGGGKGPWFKGHAQRSKGKEIGVSLTTPESVWQLQEALHANVCESMNTLERKPDARNGHVRFDERGVETERMAGYSGTGNRKGRTRLRPAFTPPRHSSTLQTRFGVPPLGGEAQKPPKGGTPNLLQRVSTVFCRVEEWRGGVKAGRSRVRPFRLPVPE